jgi:hypothetical protein
LVAGTLTYLYRDEVVIAMRDSFTEGPLGDADSGGRSRIEWHKRINPEIDAAALLSFVDAADIWAHVRDVDADVMLWHGLHPAERIFALRACWHLRDRAERVHEVALHASDAKWRGDIARPQFYDMVSIARLEVLLKARGAARTRPGRRSTREAMEELRRKKGDWIRVLDGDEIVERPLTAWDELIVANANTWISSETVLGRVLGLNAIGFSFLRWRIRELLKDGSLESRNEPNRIGLPTELRRRDR